MRFSVVIATRDRAAHLATAIPSVLAQICTDLEVIVADDGSTDDTAAVARGFDDDRVVYVPLEALGVDRARNAGARASRGTFLAFLDDDDVVDPGWLAALDELLVADPDARVASCGVLYRHLDGREEVCRPRDLGPAFGHVRGFFDSGSFVVARSLFDEVEGYTDDLAAMHQTDLVLRLADASDAFVATDEVLVQVNQRASEGRLHVQPDRLVAGTTDMLDRLGDIMGRDKRMVADYHAIAGVGSYRIGRPAAARRHFAAAVRSRPSHLKHWLRWGIACVPPAGRRVWRWTPQVS